jgi:hypothetical protein
MKKKTEAQADGQEAWEQLKSCLASGWRAVVAGIRALARLTLKACGGSDAVH